MGVLQKDPCRFISSDAKFYSESGYVVSKILLSRILEKIDILKFEWADSEKFYGRKNRRKILSHNIHVVFEKLKSRHGSIFDEDHDEKIKQSFDFVSVKRK